MSRFATDVYADDPCTCFTPKKTGHGAYEERNNAIIAKMQKAISVIQFKLEGQDIKAHPEHGMENRLLLDKMYLEKGTVNIRGREYKLLDSNFPTVDPKDPYALTFEEQRIIDGLQTSFVNCEKLQRHIELLYKKGSMYKYYNNSLMFHGCIPMNADGTFKEMDVYGVKCHGKALFERCETLVRQGRYAREGSEARKLGADFMWYLWCGSQSPLFGKNKMATFERYFTDDKELHKEVSDPYFKLAYTSEMVDKILEDFGIENPEAIIINGHIPVKIKKGESPIKADGRLILIDGGLSKAYQSVTGIAGYTLVSNSHQIFLAEHEPFTSVTDSVRNNADVHSRTIPVRSFIGRKKISDTDEGRDIAVQIQDLEKLLAAYRAGIIKQGNER